MTFQHTDCEKRIEQLQREKKSLHKKIALLEREIVELRNKIVNYK